VKPIVFLTLVFFAGHSLASSVILVDGTDWGFQFEPTSDQTRTNGSTTGEFQFEAITKSGFIVSGFVELAKGKGTSAETCRAHYWGLSSKNPAIVKDSVVVASKGGEFEVVSYVVTGSEGRQQLVQINANYYGFRDGKCIDVHISQAFPDNVKPDYSNMLSFAKSFGYTKAK